MITLASTTDKLQAFLSGAAATTNPTVTVVYHDIQIDQKIGDGEYPRGRDFTVLAGATETDILDAPPRNVCRHVDSIDIYNADTAAINVTVCIDDNTTNRILVKVTLGIGYTLHGEFYLGGRGWYVTDSDGALVTGISEISGSWTPTLTFATPGDLNVVYSSRVGYYLRRGSLVYYSFNIATSTFTHGTASGNLQVTGLPFTALNVSAVGNRGSCQIGGYTKANYTMVTPQIANNTALIIFNVSGSAQAADTLDTADMPTGGTVTLVGNVLCYL